MTVRWTSIAAFRRGKQMCLAQSIIIKYEYADRPYHHQI